MPEEAREKKKLYRDEQTGRYVFFCPGCRHAHQFYVEKPPHLQCPKCNERWLPDNPRPCAHTEEPLKGPQWTFDGNMEAPTFGPSLRIEWGDESGARCCHLNLLQGKIHFCPDSTHELAGKVVEMEPF